MIDRELHRRRGDTCARGRRACASPAPAAWANTCEGLRRGLRLGLAAATVVTCGLAEASALLGGSISLNMAGGGAACAFNQGVPLTTPQDTFALSGATSSSPLCGGRTMSAAMHGDAATPSVGLKLSASGPLTTGAAVVHFYDEWIFTPPVGTPTGLVMLPVTLSLDGLVAPGSVYASGVGRFLDYTLAISDKSGLADPLQMFRADGKVSTTGFFSQTWTGIVALNNYNAAALPMTAVVELGLSVPNLLEGTVDFFNTASISMTLPPGFSARTSSGLPLLFDPPPPPPVSVSVPGTMALLAVGLSAVGWSRRRRQVDADFSASCKVRHITLPVPLLGRLSTNCTMRGAL